MESPARIFKVDQAEVRIFSNKASMGEAAAGYAAAVLRDAIADQGQARIVVATGPSQDDFIRALVRIPAIEWRRVEVFHMDEYVGMPREHPASFRKWLSKHVVDEVHPGKVNYLDADAPDLAQECRRYEALLQSAPIDACFLGFGENGHIAFNEPGIANFSDPLTIRRVTVDERTRMQQVGENHFASLEVVPKEALTITVPALLAAKHLVCCVPELRKADATRRALEEPISTTCPASVVRTHPKASVFLDAESASLLALPALYRLGLT